jgi:biotin carboxyl carrier protein
MTNNRPKSTLTIPTGLPSDYKADERILSPIPGVVQKVFVKAGDRVNAGDPLLVIEAMKMKNTFRSAHELTVAEVNVAEGEIIKAGQKLIGFII